MSNNADQILARILAGIGDEYDTSKGSFFYDGAAPASVEMEKLWQEADKKLQKAFVATATGADLERLVYDRELLVRKPATKAAGLVVFTGVPGTRIALGTIVRSERSEYRTSETAVIDTDGFAECGVIAVESGAQGNVAANVVTVMAVTQTGVYSVNNPEKITGGYNEESDNDLRERYYDLIRDPPTSGNPAHYRQWAMEVTGVGGAKVLPRWNGPGTVKVVIVSSNNESAEEKLVDAVAENIESKRPVGAIVTVESAVEKPIDISATILLTGAQTASAVQEAMEKALESYLAAGAFATPLIRYNRISEILMSIEGVEDYTSLTVNGAEENVSVADTEIAVKGTVSIGVSQ